MPPRTVVVNKLDHPWAQPAGGALLVLAGGFLLKLSIFDTVVAVRERAPEVSFSTRTAVVGLIAAMIGLLLLAASAKGVSLRRYGGLGVRDRATGKLTGRGWALVVGTLAVSIAVEIGVRSYLRAHGYGDSGARRPDVEEDAAAP